MSGTKFLLDTNIIIGLIKGSSAALDLLQYLEAIPQTSAYSFITRIELLGFPALTDAEAQATTTVLQTMQYLPLTAATEDMTIRIRRQYSLKVPDAIIAATAKVHQIELVTLDQQLATRMTNILEQA
ncbi:type II toxin-antitoxin system VapC family toxin [Sphaerothrix gracilis]|uniref:type II toxin-antitoxin system VapC family toxin n=1 Tax=Sphaerothrix gracilis TaxID=3151835 RepID=UPI0031FC16AF